MNERLSASPDQIRASDSELRRETADEHLRRLIGEDPAPRGPDAIRRWLNDVIGYVEIVAELTSDPEWQTELRQDASMLKLQSEMLSGPRERDDVAWGQLVGNAKDLMSGALHGPETREAAA